MVNDTEKMLNVLKSQIAAIEAKLEAERNKPETTRSKDAQCSQILDQLVKHGGHMTAAQIVEVTGLTKGTAWRRIDELERAAKVWLRVTHGANAGDRKHTVVYHADYVAA